MTTVIVGLRWIAYAAGRVWPAVKWVWGIAVVAFALPIAVDFVTSSSSGGATEWIGLHWGWPVGGFGSLAALSFVSFVGEMMRRNDARRLAFDLLKPAQDLEPADLGFQVVAPGEKVDPRFRPHYDWYVPRTAVPFESRDNAGSGQERDTQDLRSELEDGSGLVLIGSPTTGKSRTLYETVRGLSRHTVLRPKPDRAPTRDELSVVPRGDMVVLLDNLDEYAQAEVNLSALRRDLEADGRKCVVAAACKDGTELNAIREALDPGFRQFYGNIPNKLWLQSPPAAKQQPGKLSPT